MVIVGVVRVREENLLSACRNLIGEKKVRFNKRIYLQISEFLRYFFKCPLTHVCTATVSFSSTFV